MYKLITHGRIILIGLSSILLSGCPGNPLTFDPPDKIYRKYFKNKSGLEIHIAFTSNSGIVENDTIVIANNEAKTRWDFAADDNGVINKCIDDFVFFDYTIILIVENEIKRKWTIGDSINSPFNYDSWAFEALEPDARNVVGKITFTITDDDLN